MKIPLGLFLYLGYIDAAFYEVGYPVGVQMCTKRCKLTFHCKGVEYDNTFLLCKMTTENVQKGDLLPSRHHWISIKDPLLICSNGVLTEGTSVLIKTGSGTKTCIKVFHKKIDRQPALRMLIAHLTNWGPVRSFLDINLTSYTNKNYPYIRVDNIRTFTYVNKVRLIVMATFSPTGIMSSTLDDYADAKFLQKVKATTVAVDQERLIVFGGRMLFHGSSMCRMGINGDNFASFEIRPTYCFMLLQLVVNSMDTVYAACFKSLISITYSGVYKGTFKSGSAIGSLSYDIDRNVIYYNHGDQINKIILSENSSSKLFTSHLQVRQIDCNDDKLYITNKAGIDVVDLGNINVRPFPSIYQGSTDNIWFCIVS